MLICDTCRWRLYEILNVGVCDPYSDNVLQTDVIISEQRVKALFHLRDCVCVCVAYCDAYKIKTITIRLTQLHMHALRVGISNTHVHSTPGWHILCLYGHKLYNNRETHWNGARPPRALRYATSNIWDSHCPAAGCKRDRYLSCIVHWSCVVIHVHAAPAYVTGLTDFKLVWFYTRRNTQRIRVRNRANEIEP